MRPQTTVATPSAGADAEAGFSRSVFSVPRMDCPSEESLVRTALGGCSAVQSLSFDLAGRKLVATHRGPPLALLARLEPLGLGTTLETSERMPVDADHEAAPPDARGEARLLWVLLAINAAMFIVELAVGVLAESTGLIADSLDMFADAAVYGLSLFAVARSAALQARAAHTAGWLQMVLALGALFEVGRRFVFGSEPVSGLMMGMGLLALLANTACLVLVARKRDAGAHMKASYIFSANDVIANAGVIAAGALVAWTGSRHPDLLIGTLVAFVVLNGARRILQLRQ